MPITDFIDEASLLEVADSITNRDGQIMLFGSETDVKNPDTQIVAKNMTRLQDYMQSAFEFDILETSESSLLYPYFADCIGFRSSGITIETSRLEILSKSQGAFVNFERNIALEGTTIAAYDSKLILD